MLASSKNYDIICLQMRNYFPSLDSSMKNEFEVLLNNLRSILVSSDEIKPAVDLLLPLVYNFRVKALKWLAEQAEEIDLAAKFDEVYTKFEEVKQSPKLEILAENLLFALRSNRRVISSMVNETDIENQYFTTGIGKLKTITYDDFLETLQFRIPEKKTAERFTEWINSSLYIEVTTLATVLIYEENLAVSSKTINDLAFLVADSAQEYYALATQIDLLKQSRANNTFTSGTIDEEFINEQKYLADLGMDDFAKSFD